MRVRAGLGMMAATAIALGACGGSSYPANVQANFLNACEGNATQAQCTCLLSKVEGGTSLQTFTDAENAIENGGGTPSWLTADAAACAGAS